MSIQCYDSFNVPRLVSSVSECLDTEFLYGTTADMTDFFVIPSITYDQAGQLIGAVALLFSVAFIFRSIRKQMGF